MIEPLVCCHASMQFQGQHPLRDRARKLDEGILVIRCDMQWSGVAGAAVLSASSGGRRATPAQLHRQSNSSHLACSCMHEAGRAAARLAAAQRLRRMSQHSRLVTPPNLDWAVHMVLCCRFEVPFNIWCDTCGEHIAKGVRFNAEKKQVRMGGLVEAINCSQSPSCSLCKLPLLGPHSCCMCVCWQGKPPVPCMRPSSQQVVACSAPMR